MPGIRTDEPISKADGTSPVDLTGQVAAKAWSNMNFSTGSERDSFNVSGYVDNGTGDFDFTINADMSYANYCCQVTIITDINAFYGFTGPASLAAGAANINVTTSAGTAGFDHTSVYATMHGDLA